MLTFRNNSVFCVVNCGHLKEFWYNALNISLLFTYSIPKANLNLGMFFFFFFLNGSNRRLSCFQTQINLGTKQTFFSRIFLSFKRKKLISYAWNSNLKLSSGISSLESNWAEKTSKAKNSFAEVYLLRFLFI